MGAIAARSSRTKLRSNAATIRLAWSSKLTPGVNANAGHGESAPIDGLQNGGKMPRNPVRNDYSPFSWARGGCPVMPDVAWMQHERRRSVALIPHAHSHARRAVQQPGTPWPIQIECSQPL